MNKFVKYAKMGIMDIFTGASAGSTAPQQRQPDPSQPAFDKNTSQDPDPSKQQNLDTSTKSPMDNHKELFNIEPKKDAEGKVIQEPDPNAPFFQIDEKSLSEQISTMSFVDQQEMKESMTAALGGDQEALMQVLNKVAQSSYGKAAQLSATLAERAAKQAMERMERNLPKHLRDYNSSQSLLASNPKYNHAAVKPMVESLRKQVQQKFPDASPEEIAKTVQQYVDDFVADMTVDKKDDPTERRKAEARPETDFADYFGFGE